MPLRNNFERVTSIFNDNDDDKNDDNFNILNYPLPDRGNLSFNKHCFVRCRKRQLDAYFSQRCKIHCSMKHIFGKLQRNVNESLMLQKRERNLIFSNKNYDQNIRLAMKSQALDSH